MNPHITDAQRVVVRSIQAELELQLDAHITLLQLARKHGINVHDMTHLFLEVTGYTIKDYRVNKRIAAAKKLLVNTRMLVDDVAYAVGYEGSRALSKEFKKHTGYTPTAYREKNTPK
jgi:transcriptional regulator GlxA family with amidase domain